MNPLGVVEAILVEHNESVARRYSDVDVMDGVDRRNARALNAYEREQNRLQAEADWREERTDA